MKSKRDIRRAERAVERAIDAIDLLRDLGYGCDDTEQATERMRRVQFRVQDEVLARDA